MVIAVVILILSLGNPGTPGCLGILGISCHCAIGPWSFGNGCFIGFTLWLFNIAIENGHRNSGFSHR